MSSNFSQSDEMNRLVEKELRLLKKEYQEPEMSKEQLQELKMKMEEAKMMEQKQFSGKRVRKIALAAAAFALVFMILPNTSASIAYAMGELPVIGSLVKVVTFRDYQYETNRNMADIRVPEIKTEGAAADSETQDKLNRTAEEINAEIQKITDRLIKEFEENAEDEMGYQDMTVDSEVLETTQDYFTLKLICYQGAGSGYQWNYYYTIDLNTGERLKLKDVFVEDADYITPISENIKTQMAEQMSADENVYYWLHDEIEAFNFQAITEDTSFYLNGEGNIVICFDEGEVAPMYMGAVEFEIPDEAVSDIRKPGF